MPLIKLVLTPRVMQWLLPNGVNGKSEPNICSSDSRAAAPECIYSTIDRYSQAGAGALPSLNTTEATPSFGAPCGSGGTAWQHGGPRALCLVGLVQRI